MIFHKVCTATVYDLLFPVRETSIILYLNVGIRCWYQESAPYESKGHTLKIHGEYLMSEIDNDVGNILYCVNNPDLVRACGLCRLMI